MAAVTLDLWHTLIFLPPEEEERYMATQVQVATEVLESSAVGPGATERSTEELRRAFAAEYTRAVKEAGQGRTVTPAEQVRRAGLATGRLVDPNRYLERLGAVVGDLGFQRAPGALEFLEGLREDGYRLGVISNTVGEPGAFLRPALRAMGVERLVNAIVFSDEHPWTKPAPEIFRETLHQLSATPDEAVHVGDGWSDIEGARRAGLRAGILFTGLQNYGAWYKSLFLPDGWDRPATDHVASRLDEVREMVHTILPMR